MTAALEVTGLSFRYRDGNEALRNINLTLGKGECVGLLGPNGSGKSTLLLHLNGILPERHDGSGSVRVNGIALSDKTLHEVRRQVGLVFQNPDDQLFCASVREDVAFGPEQLGLSPAEVEERVARALSEVGLPGYGARSTHHLSQGEKRRVCLAGVLACHPSVLVLDEPTSDLDPRGRREFKELLRGIAATKIVATHDLDMAVELCPRSVVLDRGEVVADGPTRELLGNEQLMLAHGLERPHILDRLAGAQAPARPFKVTAFNPTR